MLKEPLIKSNYFKLAKSVDISSEDRSNTPLFLLTSKKIAILFSAPNSNRLNQRLLNQVFFMRYLLACLAFLVLFSSAIKAETPEVGIEVINVSSHMGDRVHYMDAFIKTKLPEYMVHAVKNGVPLPLTLQIEVKESQDWWFDKSLVTIEQQYILHYLSLVDLVRVTNLTAGSSYTVGSIKRALKKIGVINQFPLLDNEHFKVQNTLYARIRLKVNVNALPQPLRTDTLLGGSWDLSSDWKEWILQ